MAALDEFRKHCPGVLGSWIVDDQGKPGEPDLVAMLDVDVATITERLASLYAALDPLHHGPPTERSGPLDGDLVLRFDTAMLVARPVAGGLLVILAENDANLAKIRAHGNLLLKRIEHNALQGV